MATAMVLVFGIKALLNSITPSYDDMGMASTHKNTLRVIGGVALLAVTSFANKTQEQIADLIERAEQLSDIRAANAPEFRLKASVTLYDENGNSEGSYVEYWVSATRWRRETAVGNFRRIEVGNTNKRWVSEGSKDLPLGLGQPAHALTVWKQNPDAWKSGTIRERTLAGESLQCVETKPNPTGGKSALCFDKSTGLLVAKIVPLELLDRIEDQTCQYSEYQDFGGKMFPRLVRCFSGSKLASEIRVTELSKSNDFGAELFVEPDGAQETVNCQLVPKAPKPIFTPGPTLPRRENPAHPVVLRVVVGKDGKPRDMSVVRSIDKAFDGAAMDAVRRWKFEPAKCGAEPMEATINVQVEFRVQ
jgi:TonB family protein